MSENHAHYYQLYTNVYRTETEWLAVNNTTPSGQGRMQRKHQRFFTVFELQDTLESQVFDCSVKIKKLMSPACIKSEAFTLPSENKGFRLPKLDVPTFNGDIQTRDKYNYF